MLTGLRGVIGVYTDTLALGQVDKYNRKRPNCPFVLVITTTTSIRFDLEIFVVSSTIELAVCKPVHSQDGDGEVRFSKKNHTELDNQVMQYSQASYRIQFTIESTKRV